MSCHYVTTMSFDHVINYLETEFWMIILWILSHNVMPVCHIIVTLGILLWNTWRVKVHNVLNDHIVMSCHASMSHQCHFRHIIIKYLEGEGAESVKSEHVLSHQSHINVPVISHPLKFYLLLTRKSSHAQKFDLLLMPKFPTSWNSIWSSFWSL